MMAEFLSSLFAMKVLTAKKKVSLASRQRNLMSRRGGDKGADLIFDLERFM